MPRGQLSERSRKFSPEDEAWSRMRQWGWDKETPGGALPRWGDARTWWRAGESEVPHDTEVSSLTTAGKLRCGAPDVHPFGGKEVYEFSFR